MWHLNIRHEPAFRVSRLLPVLIASLWMQTAYAQSLKELNRQSQGLEKEVAACGLDLNCINRVSQKAINIAKGIENSPEAGNFAQKPCASFGGPSPSPAGVGEVSCQPVRVRIYHRATAATSGCTKADERFTYAYTYESTGQLLRDTGRKAYLLNTLPSMSGGSWRLDLEHLEYVVNHFSDCQLVEHKSFGRGHYNIGNRPSVMLNYDYGYTEPGGENVMFAPLMGWLSPQASEAHWGIGVPFQMGSGIATSFKELIQAGFKLSPADFEELFQGGTVTRKLSWKRSMHPNQSEINELNIEIGAKPTSCKLQITSPTEGHKLVFSDSKPGELTIDLVAKAMPSKHKQKIIWSLPQFDAATKVEVKPKNRRGNHLRVTLRGLPKDIAGLGEKVFTASINGQGCHTSDSRTVKLFFPRNKKNNPGGSDPNWFYYWKQTPASRPNGQLVAMSYIGGTKDLCKNPSVGAIYNPKYGYKAIQMCDLSRLKKPFNVTFPLLDRNAPKKYSGTRTLSNIDAFAVAVLHEYQHFLVYHNWYSKISPKNLTKMDKDKDGIPDHLEPGLNFNPTLFQTYLANHWNVKNVGGDEEWLAYEAMKYYKPGNLDKYDWAYPGNQWK